MRLGSGPKARIRFDLDHARQALEAGRGVQTADAGDSAPRQRPLVRRSSGGSANDPTCWIGRKTSWTCATMRRDHGPGSDRARRHQRPPELRRCSARSKDTPSDAPADPGPRRRAPVGGRARPSATARRSAPTAATRRSRSAPTSRAGTGRGRSSRPSGSSSRSSAGRGFRRGLSRARTASRRRWPRSACRSTRASACSPNGGGGPSSSGSTRTRSTTTVAARLPRAVLRPLPAERDHPAAGRPLPRRARTSRRRRSALAPSSAAGR